MNCDVHAHLLSDHHNLPVLYFVYCNSLFVRDVYRECGLISVHLFDILPAISRDVPDIWFRLAGYPAIF